MELDGESRHRWFSLLNGPGFTLVAFVAGLIIGLVVLGWYIFPVQWTNARPVDLAGGYREDYLVMVAESYARTGNADLARRRLSSFNAAAIQKAADALNQQGLAVEAQHVRAMIALVAAPGTPVAAAATPTPLVSGRVTPGPPPAVQVPAAGPGSPNLARLVGLIGMSCLLVALIVTGAIIVLSWLLRTETRPAWLRRLLDTRPAIPVATPSVRTPPRERAPVVQVRPGWDIGELALNDTVVTEYAPGEIYYYESYHIKDKNEMLGECGVRIAETLSSLDRDHPPAFDIWLYDRIDDRTVKAVVLTEQAYSDRALRRQLAGNGQPISPEPGKILFLETANLHLEAELVAFEYGQPKGTPGQAFFEQFSVQLTPTRRDQRASTDQAPSAETQTG